MENYLLEVKNVSKIFDTGFSHTHQTAALEDFSLAVSEDAPTIIAIAGESGSGKTTLARIILDLLSSTRGDIFWRGQSISQMSKSARMIFRKECQAVFQDPYQAYNPFYRVDHMFKMAMSDFKLARNKVEERKMIEEAMEVVGLRPEEILGKFPHQLSGGQRQRAMVARAFLLKPRLIVADEPVSMIDTSLRATILDIMLTLKKDFGMSFLYITHDLSTAYQISDQIIILYQGSVAEKGEIAAVIEKPQHPYTQMLLGSIPIPDPSQKWEGRVEISLDDQTKTGAERGCKFSDRCPHAMDICSQGLPPLYRVGDEQYASCYLYKDSEVSPNSVRS